MTPPDRIAVLGGTGPFGRALAFRLSLSNVPVAIGSRDARRAEDAARRIRERRGDRGGAPVTGALNRDAASGAGVICLAAPFAGQGALLREVGPVVTGLVACCAVIWPPGSRPETSAAEEAARVLHEATGGPARVAAAFQTVAASVLDEDPDRLADRAKADSPDVLVFADRDEDRAAAARMAALSGLPVVQAGGLRGARRAEAALGLLIGINRRRGVSGAGIRITGISG